MASRWRIEAGFVFATVAILFAHPTPVSIEHYVPLVIAALALRCWARGHLERRAHLTESGPYALVRHPLYVGSFVLGLAFCLMTNVTVLPALFALAFASVYLPKAWREETFLRARYGEQYARYADHVGAFVPRFAGVRAVLRRPHAGHFAWQRVVRHREYRTWLGAGAAVAVLILRALWPATPFLH
jgi:hypothetical protein